MLIPTALVAIIACVSMGCGDNTDVSVDVDASLPDTAHLDITFNGPSPQTLTVGQNDGDTICFTAIATADVEIRALHLFVDNFANTAAGGLLDTTGSTIVPNFTDIKVIDLATNAVVSGPLDVGVTSDDIYQSLDATSPFTISAYNPQLFCLRVDIADNVALVGNRVLIQIGSLRDGDAVTLSDNAALPLANIHPNNYMSADTSVLAAP